MGMYQWLSLLLLPLNYNRQIYNYYAKDTPLMRWQKQILIFEVRDK
jgi:hypothetical protein